ncbi:hypothetical protein AYL99_07281 [Fonsecaea erecta]|uniref:Uncharacterized protein n=1 Tax=Fonsecaea erecta TaxID=1367422 RepID=A0A178ZFC7_9EURO|nr:hypothetical protein AYL99_07281 [Fonsecaea erecta]OAP58191.1 hypothetical protein AYL99_07281 [Fonsecaea erecta]
MASAVAVDTLPRQPHTLSEDPSTAFLSSSCSKSPRRSPDFANSSTPLPEPDTENKSSSPPRCYTFTPQHVKSLPRAWERRPATPFVARNDTQKIWKRVPLGVIGTNIGKNWRKETKRLSTRPVKKLRIAHLGEEEEKENVDYVASRWDEDGMTTPSPKRKALECGAVADRERGLDDRIEDDEDSGPPEHGTASPILGSHDKAESWMEGEGVGIETVPSTVSDIFDASLEAVALPQVLSPTTQPPHVSSTFSLQPVTIQSVSHIPMTPLDGDTTSCGVREQDSPSSSIPVSSDRSTMESIDNPPDHDDTAFLHDFLSRARARKAAKEQGLGDILAQTGETAAETANSLVEESRFCHIEDVTSLSVPVVDEEKTPTNLPAAPEPEISMSPRRSSRLVTRLPRLQKPVTSLPNNVPLKRLSGTEFIAANHEAQSMAVATRTNTKSNKSGAVSAKVRLIQLNAELKARQSSAAEGVKEPNPETLSKKKNNKKKEVTWAEKLATFQEERDAEGSGDETGEERNEQSTSDNNSEAERGSKAAAEKPHSLLQHQNRGIKKVRKLRKLTAGSVNGTPAPKKTTNIPLPVGPNSNFLSAKVAGMVMPVESDLEDQKNTVQTRTRTRTRISKIV